MIRSRKILKSVGDKRHPWRTPTDVRNQLPISPFKNTALVASVYRFSIRDIRLLLTLYFFIVAMRAWCHTLSKAFLKSINTWYKLCWCSRDFSQRTRRLKICSTVLLPGIKPACSSAIISAACGLSLFKMILRRILLG